MRMSEKEGEGKGRDEGDGGGKGVDEDMDNDEEKDENEQEGEGEGEKMTRARGRRGRGTTTMARAGTRTSAGTRTWTRTKMRRARLRRRPLAQGVGAVAEHQGPRRPQVLQARAELRDLPHVQRRDRHVQALPCGLHRRKRRRRRLPLQERHAMLLGRTAQNCDRRVSGFVDNDASPDFPPGTRTSPRLCEQRSPPTALWKDVF